MVAELFVFKYWYKILIDGKVKHTVENDDPAAFRNVKVYAGVPGRDSMAGSIKELVIKGVGNEKGCFS